MDKLHIPLGIPGVLWSPENEVLAVISGIVAPQRLWPQACGFVHPCGVMSWARFSQGEAVPLQEEQQLTCTPLLGRACPEEAPVIEHTPTLPSSGKPVV